MLAQQLLHLFGERFVDLEKQAYPRPIPRGKGEKLRYTAIEPQRIIVRDEKRRSGFVVKDIAPHGRTLTFADIGRITNDEVVLVICD